jgi:hypothetical protein
MLLLYVFETLHEFTNVSEIDKDEKKNSLDVLKQFFHGMAGGTRTLDIHRVRMTFSPLNYGHMVGPEGFEPPTYRVKAEYDCPFHHGPKRNW